MGLLQGLLKGDTRSLNNGSNMPNASIFEQEKEMAERAKGKEPFDPLVAG